MASVIASLGVCMLARGAGRERNVGFQPSTNPVIASLNLPAGGAIAISAILAKFDARGTRAGGIRLASLTPANSATDAPPLPVSSGLLLTSTAPEDALWRNGAVSSPT